MTSLRRGTVLLALLVLLTMLTPGSAAVLAWGSRG